MPLGTLKDNENFIYFKGEEETDAIAVNCIRSGDGCTEAHYRDKSLTTEHGMQLRLNQGDMGVVSLKEKLLLDDMEGIRIAGSGALHILAAGEVKIAASEVRVAGTGGVLLYEGTAEADQEGNIVVAPQGKIELSAEDGERAIHNRGKEVTYYLAWEHEDLSHPSNRYRDAPQQKDYDWMKLGTHVAAGLMVAGGIAALAAGGVFLVGAAAATAAKMAMTVFLAGSLYVGEQALSDIRSGRVSDLDRYTRKAVAGSVVGFLTGASGLLMAEASLCGVLALGFGEGLVGSIVTQKLLNEDGEIDWGVAIAEAGFSEVTAGVAWKAGRSVRGGNWNHDSFRKNADPFREVMGTGVESHPEKWNALLNEMKNNGVEVVYREGAMAYSPAKGVAGQLVVDPSASYSVLLHEYTHYLDDVAAGFPGMEYHFQTINRVKMELHAYMQGIKLADSLGYKDVSKQLFENNRNERELLTSHLK